MNCKRSISFAVVGVAFLGTNILAAGVYPIQAVPATSGEEMITVMRALELVEKTFLGYAANAPTKGRGFDLTRSVQIIYSTKASDPSVQRAGIFFEIKRNEVTEAWVQFQFRGVSSSVQVQCAYYTQEDGKKILLKNPDSKLVEYFDNYLSIIKNKLAGDHWAKALNEFNKDHPDSIATMGGAYKETDAQVLIDSQRGYSSKKFFQPTHTNNVNYANAFESNYGEAKFNPPITIDKFKNLLNLKTRLTDMRYLPIEILKSCDSELQSISQKSLDEIKDIGFQETAALSILKTDYISILYRGDSTKPINSEKIDQTFLESKLFKDDDPETIKKIARSEYSFGFTATTVANLKLIEGSEGFILKDKRQHSVWIKSSSIIEAAKGKPFKLGFHDLSDIFEALNMWSIPAKAEDTQNKSFVDRLLAKVDSKNHHLTTVCPWPQIYIDKGSNIILKYRSYLPLNNYQIFIYPMSIREDIPKGILSYAFHKDQKDSVRVKRPWNDYIAPASSWDGMNGISGQFGSLPEGVYMVGIANHLLPNSPIVGSIFQVGMTVPNSGPTTNYCF